MKINTTRFIVLSKDKTKILTHKGFTTCSHINYGNPKLFANVSAAKQDLLIRYPEEIINDCIFVKVQATYDDGEEL